MADRGGTRRTGPGCGHPRVSVPELPAPRGRQRRPHAHRPVGRSVAIEPTSRRLGGSARVAAAGGRERGRSHPCRHRWHRRRRNADPSALGRARGRRVAVPERRGPRRCRLSEPRGQGHARRECFGDSRRERDPNRAAWHRAAATRSSTDRSSATGRGADTAGSHADADADTQPDGHTDRHSVDSDERDAIAQPEPDGPALAVTHPEPVMRKRMRAVSEPCLDATLVRVLRSSGAQT